MVISRRDFGVMVAKGVGLSVLVTSHGSFSNAGKFLSENPTEAKIKISTIEGVRYPASFLRFVKHARFDSSEDAIASVQDGRIAYRLEIVAT